MEDLPSVMDPLHLECYSRQMTDPLISLMHLSFLVASMRDDEQGGVTKEELDFLAQPLPLPQFGYGHEDSYLQKVS